VETEIIAVDPARPDPTALARAAERLAAGAIVAFPTETVYGLGCLPEHAESVARIYAIKNRRLDQPLAFYLVEPGEISRAVAAMSSEARQLIEHFLPGPLTIILKDMSGSKVGFRVSSNQVLIELVTALGRPLVGTSANLSGHRSPTTPAEVLRDLEGRIDTLLDAGKTALGIDSTVVDCTSSPPTLVREGAIPADEISRVLGVTVARFAKPPGSSS